MGAFCGCYETVQRDTKNKEDEKKEEKAPPGSWLPHVDKDKNNSGGIMWLNNHTKVLSYQLYYLPWDVSSAPGDKPKNLKEAKPFKMDGDPKKIPAGSWLQHVRDDGSYCWKNHTTGGYAKSIYYLKDDAPSSLSAAPENLLKAQFVFVPKKKKSDDEKKDPAKPPKNINVYGHPWIEKTDEKTGKRFWVHRGTGERRDKDPLR